MSELPPLIAGIADQPNQGGDCGCCAGSNVATPESIFNRPGLATVSYRPGSFADFRRSQLARLSSADLPALADLKSRDADDFSIALIDAWSGVCDVLAFYQERNANEAWLGTAVERRSLVELGRLIGYRLGPGVAASTDLVFLMNQPAGAPASVTAVEIAAGTRVQSVPGPGETAQTFETGDAIDARVAWNALGPRQSRPVAPRNGDLGLWVSGVATGLGVGDAIVIVGAERAAQPLSERWDFRKLTEVTADPAADRTWIGWTHPLGSIDPPGLTAQGGHRLFALRTRASLFGWNAPHPKLLADGTRARYGFDSPTDTSDWSFSIPETPPRITLDAIQPGFVRGGWVALTHPDAFVELYRIAEATDDGVAEFAVSGRATRLTLDTATNLGWLRRGYRRVSAYGQSEELGIAETPLFDPVAGDAIDLAGLAGELPSGRRLVIRGRRAQAIATAALTLIGDAGSRLATAGTRLTLLAAPLAGPAGTIWHLRAPGGFAGFVTLSKPALRFVAALADAGTIAESAVLEAVEVADDTHARLRLAVALTQAFDRATTVIHANVAAATHGETTQEIVGSGTPGRPFQSFALKQAPLTYILADNAAGAASTLALRVGELLWREVPTLYGTGPRDRVFETRTDDDGATIVQFGDGASGARPPAGRNNLVATYRKGLGRAGSVAAGALTTALDRPLGLSEVFNPHPATGGDDPQRIEDARDNAPVTVLTLGRVVSLSNYADFARAFAGIAKARADWAWDGEGRRILVTVAGPGGATVPPESALAASLMKSMRTLGDPFVRLSVRSFRPAFFRVKIRVSTHPDRIQKQVLAAIEAALRETFGFARRGFAPLVAASEVIAVVQAVPGVVAVDLDRLHRTAPPGAAPILHQRLLAQPARMAGATWEAAEILTLDPGPIELGFMP